MLKKILFFYFAGSNVMRVVRLTKQKGKSMEECLNLFKGKVVTEKG